jgi:hypothetical protein
MIIPLNYCSLDIKQHQIKNTTKSIAPLCLEKKDKDEGHDV